MADLLPEGFLGAEPSLDPDVFVAAGARLVGEVRLEAGASVWYNCVLRADLAAISIGRNTNLQDGTLVHVETGRPCRIADHVTVGHGAILHACTVESGCLIGMGAIILDGAVIGRESIVGAGSVVTPGKQFPPRSLIMGTPAKVVKEVSEVQLQEMQASWRRYVALKNEYHQAKVGDCF